MTDEPRHTAWEMASYGATPRLLLIYQRTIDRAKARGIIPDSLRYTISDRGFGMEIHYLGASWRVSQVFSPARDSIYGFIVQPPKVFKGCIRQVLTPPKKETIQ